MNKDEFLKQWNKTTHAYKNVQLKHSTALFTSGYSLEGHNEITFYYNRETILLTRLKEVKRVRF